MANLAVLKATNNNCGLALLYVYMGSALVRDYGVEGDAAVRKSLVYYATWRGAKIRAVHQALGMKTNLYNFAKYNSGGYTDDSPGKGSFYNVTPYSDVHDTIVCPFVQEMIDRGHRDLAVTYCEEVHPPLWQSYAPTAIVNLGRTLAQEDSNQCLFDVFLRPGRMTPKERTECFEEFDPDFKGDQHEKYEFPTQQQSHRTQMAYMVTGFCKAAVELLGHGALESITGAMEPYLNDYLETLKTSAKENDLPFTREFLRDHCLFSWTIEEDGALWDDCGTPEVRDLADKYIYSKIREKLENEV